MLLTSTAEGVTADATAMLKLDLIQTVAFAGVVLYLGYGIRRVVKPLARYNIPAPVIGGLLVAGLVLLARQSQLALFEFNVTLQSPLMIAFFTAVGFSASFSLLKKGGVYVLVLLGLATLFAALQNLIGISLSYLLGVPPLFGVIVGSVTLAGGPATGLAFAPLFETSRRCGRGFRCGCLSIGRHRLRELARQSARHFFNRTV